MVSLSAAVDETGYVFSIEVPDDLAWGDFKAYLSAETGIEPEDQVIQLNGKELNGEITETLEQLGLKNDEMLIIKKRSNHEPGRDTHGGISLGRSVGPDQRIEMLRQELLRNPEMRRQVSQMNPVIDQCIDDAERFRDVVGPALEQTGLLQGGGQQLPGGVSSEEWMRLQQDPDNPDNQKRIMELIEQDQIEENMRAALEMTPESFASVTMLYINVEVNGHPVKAFVDSGAQTTIMSTRLAESCNLTRLIDKRFKGEARGVGKTEIVGRIHSAQLKIEDRFIPCSFTVLDTHVDMLLGLDMLRRHQACIDLKNNKLVIEGIETEFLPEAEVPKEQLLAGAQQLGTSEPKQAKLPSSTQSSSSASSTAAAAAAAAAESRSRARSSVQQPQLKVDESVVSNLMALGFSRDEVIRALQQAGGNAEIAASLLFQ